MDSGTRTALRGVPTPVGVFQVAWARVWRRIFRRCGRVRRVRKISAGRLQLDRRDRTREGASGGQAIGSCVDRCLRVGKTRMAWEVAARLVGMNFLTVSGVFELACG